MTFIYMYDAEQKLWIKDFFITISFLLPSCLYSLLQLSVVGCFKTFIFFTVYSRLQQTRSISLLLNQEKIVGKFLVWINIERRSVEKVYNPFKMNTHKMWKREMIKRFLYFLRKLYFFSFFVADLFRHLRKDMKLFMMLIS